MTAPTEFTLDVQIGEAVVLCYLRDIITASNKDGWSKEEVLLLLLYLSKQEDLFPDGIGVKMWGME